VHIVLFTELAKSASLNTVLFYLRTTKNPHNPKPTGHNVYFQEFSKHILHKLML